MDKKTQNRTVRTVCTMHDGFACGLLAHVVNGIITKVEPGDFPHRVDRGACAIGLATAQLVYHPDRLRYPMRRVGERGEGRWQRISWDEAMDGISAKHQEIAQRYGSSAIAWDVLLSYLQGAGYARLASLTKGSWVSGWGFGDAAGPCADLATFGHYEGLVQLSDVEDPKFIIVWGWNPAVTDYRRMRRILEARKGGSKLVVIDPILTATASRADEHIPIRPGTDGALALAMVQVILDKGLQDERFIAENTVGPLLVRCDNGLFLRESDVTNSGSQHRFMVCNQITGLVQPSDTPDVTPALTGSYSIAGIKCKTAYQLLADMVREYTPERVSEITDIPAGTIQHLATNYGTRKPASIHRGWGMQRSFYGDLSCRAINTLAAITGNINLKRPSRFVLNLESFYMPGGPYNRVPFLLLYDAIAKGEPLTIKALWFAGENFVNQMPNANRTVKELFPSLDLIVVSDFFMNATAKYADYVLPVATSYECVDVYTNAYQPFYLQLQQKVIEPLYECKSDFQIAAELGRKMGFDKYFDKTEEQYIEELLASGHPTMEGISLEKLKEGPVLAKTLYEPQQFKTPTGRIEFYVERLKRFGQELPIYLEPVESARSEKARAYPLTLLSTHAKNRIHSTMVNVPSLQRLDPEPTLEINSADAKARDINDSDVVLVFNERGKVKLKAKLSQYIKPGVVNITEGWWPEHYMEGHHNQLTHDRVNLAQKCISEPNAAFYDVLVEVKKAE